MQSHELILLFRTNAHFHSGSRVHSDKRRKPVCEYLVKIFPRRYSDSRAQRRRTYLVRTRTSNRNEFTFNFGTFVFVARSGGRWASRSSIERRKKKSRKSIGAPWVYASSYAPLFLLDLMRAGVIYHNSGIVLRQFKAPNEHKFDCLFALLMQFLTRTRYISTNLSAIFLLGVTFRQVFSKINYAKGCASKLQQKN